MDYRHTAFNTAAGSTLPAPQQTNVAPASNCRKLLAGRAVTLRAKQLSVLRIVRGRVWATLTDAGCYSRVLAGDHFLSRGQSLTLLPGQELVMESFNASASSATATAHFNWETLGVAASARQDARPAHRAISMGVRQPLRDLRQALGLVAAVPPVATLTSVVAPVTLSRTNTSSLPLVSPATRLLAAEEKAT